MLIASSPKRPLYEKHCHQNNMKTSTPNLTSMLVDGPAAPLPIQWLGRLVDWSVVVIGAVMITLVFFNVLSHAIGKDLAATTELCELLMVWVTFLGGAAAARRGAHMSINEFLDKLGVSNRRWADTAIGLLCLAMLGMLIFYGISITQTGTMNELTVLHVSMAWQYAALPVGATAMLVFVGWDTYQAAIGVSREERYPPAEHNIVTEKETQ
jgi:TRAP-type transport system small permease protein